MAAPVVGILTPMTAVTNVEKVVIMHMIAIASTREEVAVAADHAPDLGLAPGPGGNAIALAAVAMTGDADLHHTQGAEADQHLQPAPSLGHQHAGPGHLYAGPDLQFVEQVALGPTPVQCHTQEGVVPQGPALPPPRKTAVPGRPVQEKAQRPMLTDPGRKHPIPLLPILPQGLKPFLHLFYISLNSNLLKKFVPSTFSIFGS